VVKKNWYFKTQSRINMLLLSYISCFIDSETESIRRKARRDNFDIFCFDESAYYKNEGSLLIVSLSIQRAKIWCRYLLASTVAAEADEAQFYIWCCQIMQRQMRIVIIYLLTLLLFLSQLIVSNNLHSFTHPANQLLWMKSAEVQKNNYSFK
jgi:hypothetical protein